MKKQSGKILLAGGSGLVGSIIKRYLEQQGNTVHILSRSESSGSHMIRWDPDGRFIEDHISNHTYDALVNLCGAGIAEKRWTPDRKKVLYDSRINPTRFLWDLIKNRRLHTGKFIQISASGYYGNRLQPVNEEDPPGSEDNFMVQLTKKWEEVFLENAIANIPHCRVRLGVVISARGGFIGRFLTPVRFFISPYFGNGDNYISWIHSDDLAAMIHVLINKEDLPPVCNLATPHPVTSKEFSKTLSKVFNPGAVSIPVPAWGINVLFGEMKEAILANVQMMPDVFQEMGYDFETPEMKEALEKVLRVES